MKRDSDVLIEAKEVSKVFCRDLKRSLLYGLADMAGEFFPGSGSKLRKDEFLAVDNVNFQLKRGECLGLVGKNGAGKTTLLKMLNGVIKPDKGHIRMRGRVCALIALGAGFNPILTGRENIYVNGAVLGFKKREIDSQFDELVDFAELKDFINAPVQSYSSGMLVRLGFSLATAIDPDVLLLDEVLAVGDASFRDKCYRRIGEIRKTAAIIFVSHSMQQVNRLCDTGLLLDHGVTKLQGDISDVTRAYLKDTGTTRNDLDSDSFQRFSPPLIRMEAPQHFHLKQDQTDVEVKLTLETERPVQIEPRLQLYADTGEMIAETARQELVDLPTGDSTISLIFPATHLNPGKFWLSLLLYDEHYPHLLGWLNKVIQFEIEGACYATTAILLPLRTIIHEKDTPCSS